MGGGGGGSAVCLESTAWQRIFCWSVAYRPSNVLGYLKDGSAYCTYCHTKVELAGQTYYFIQSQYIDTGPTSPSSDPVTPGAWQGSQRSTSVEVTGMTGPGKNIHGQSGNRT